MITIDLRMWNSSGIGRYLKNVVPSMVSKNDDVEFTLLGKTEELKVFEQYSNATVININLPPFSLQTQLVINSFIPAETDLLWWPLYNPPINCKHPLITTIFDCYHLDLSYERTRFFKKMYAKFMFRNAIRKSEKILTISQFSKNEIEKNFPNSGKKINVISLGANGLNATETDKSEIFFKRPFILSVCNIKPHKNLPLLVKAFKKLHKDVNIDLVLIGKKSGLLNADRHIFKLAKALDDRIHFIEGASDQLIIDAFQQAKIYVFPSLYEGFSLTPLEALHQDCRVLISDIPAHREIFGNSPNLFSPNNVEELTKKILLCLSGDKQLGDSHQIMKNTATKYNWSNCAAQTEKVILETYQNVKKDEKNCYCP